MFLKEKTNQVLRRVSNEFSQYVLAGTFISLLTIVVSMTLIRGDLRNAHAEQRLNAVEQARAMSSSIEGLLSSYGVLSESIAAVAANNPNLSQSEFSAYVNNIGTGFPEVINIAAAPDLVVQYVHPLEPNVAAIGLDYRQDVSVYAAIQRTLAQRRAMFSGPVGLVQGGEGIVIRTPVFVDLQESGDTRFWGVTAIVVDLDGFLRASGILERSNNWQLSIRRVVSSDHLGEVFFGNPDLVGANAVTVPIRQSGLEWELSMSPNGGWLSTAPNAVPILALVMSIGALLLAITMMFIRMFFDRERARKQLLVAIESINDAFILTDEDGQVVMSNARYAELYGPRGASGSLQRHRPDNTEQARNGLHEQGGALTSLAEMARLGQRDDSGESEHQLEDGTWLRVSRQATADGGIVELSADITELKQTQLAAEMANEAKTDFLHVVSHELRTPLTIILGYLAFLGAPTKIPANAALKKKLEAQVDGPQDFKEILDQSLANIAEIATRAEASGQHLLALINQILDFSKIENGNVDVNCKDLAVADVLQEVEEQFGVLAAEKNLELVVGKSDATVCADPLRLRQILINLVGNSLKFTASGSIEVWADTEGDNIRFHVRDTGAGIAPSDREAVFEKFKQLDTSSTRSEGGVGLGLPISKHLVELHGGTIELQSKVGIGTHISFLLLLRSAVQSAA